MTNAYDLGPGLRRGDGYAPIALAPCSIALTMFW
jgi:hypothetical protein